MSDVLVVLATAALPVSELRGAIPLGAKVLNMPLGLVVPVAVVGNALPVPLILLLFRPLKRLTASSALGRKLFERAERRARSRGSSVERLAGWGLFLFVAVPLPVTGAWTGSLVASVLGMRLRTAFVAIGGGILGAALVVTSLTLMGYAGAAVALVALAVFALVKLRRKSPAPHSKRR